MDMRFVESWDNGDLFGLACLRRKWIMKFLALSLALWLFPWAEVAHAGDAFECKTVARFASEGSIGKAVIDAIRGTKKRVMIALYGFDNSDLGAELLALAKKQVAVRLKVDTERSASKRMTKLLEDLKAGGVQVQTVAPNGRNHNKFAVIDGSIVLTGSYNWTLKAEKNWENLLILDCPGLAKAYESEWNKIH
jgi:phosphatidylserine/phosphatidylglycerophosphate/cardiolipin synthase-like enzyme